MQSAICHMNVSLSGLNASVTNQCEMSIVRRQNLVDLKLPELRETLAHQVVLMLITVMHLLAERQGL